MGTSNLDRLIIPFPHSNMDSQKISNTLNHPCKSSSSQTPIPIGINSQESDQTVNRVSGAEFKVGNDEDNPKTPRSAEHKIPVMATCPPAPRKAKQVPTNGKRRASCFPVVRVPADFVVYLDAMLALNETVYVPDIVVDDLAKRLKLLPPPAHEV